MVRPLAGSNVLTKQCFHWMMNHWQVSVIKKIGVFVAFPMCLAREIWILDKFGDKLS